MGSKTFGCVKNTIRLRSGRYFDFLDPQPDQFTFSDITGALSKICRFGGQCPRFYSVAEHCWHCAGVAETDGLSPVTQIACLLHDATEAFCGDVVKPLKIMLPDYAQIEARVQTAIANKFSVDFEAESGAVREIDWAMLIAERRGLFSPDTVKWHGEDEVRRLSVPFFCWQPNYAESAFCNLAGRLGIDTEQ